MADEFDSRLGNGGKEGGKYREGGGEVCGGGGRIRSWE